MPPRTYDFSQYQTPGQSFLGGVGQGFRALENVRRDRKQERQGDDAFKLQLQKILDDMNRERIKMGADPLASPLGGAQGRQVQPTPGFNPNATTPIPSPSLGAGGAATVQGPPEQVVGGLRRTIGGMLERFQGGYETPQLSTLTKTGPSENESLLKQRHGFSLEEGAFEHGNRMELEGFQQDRIDAREKADRGLRAREIDIRSGIDGRNSLIYEINLRNAEINDLQQQQALVEQTKKNLNVMQFGGDLQAMQAAAAQLESQSQEFGRRIQASMEGRNSLMRRLSGDSAPQPTAPAPRGGVDPVSTLRSQAEQAIAAGADPAAVSARFQQAFSQMVGQSLGNTSKDRGFGHR